MKRLPIFLLVYILLFVHSGNAAEIYVSPNGNDANPGTKEQPLATLQTAIRKARNLKRLNDAGIKDEIHIILRGGTFQVLETIVIRPEDSSIFIEAAENEKPVLSGGVQISNWRKLTTAVNGLQKNIQSKIWVADVPQVNGNNFNFRQLWVNDVKAVRAKSSNGETMLRILNWNKAEAACVIPTLAFQNLDKTKGVELFIHQWWEIANLRIKKMLVMGDSTKVFFEQPESKIQNEHPWPAPWLSKETGNSAFYLTNAPQFLDEPGEWFLDNAQHKIYYWPRSNENLTTAHVIAPFTETLLRLQGTAENPVKHVVLDGISFQHTGWLQPSLQGHVPHQMGLYMTEAYRLKPAGTKEKPGLDNQAWVGRPPGTLALEYAAAINISGCRFEHLGSTGLDVADGTKALHVKGNLFKDIGGNGMLLGNFGEKGREIHLPYNPDNANEAVGLAWINNNLITNIGTEDWGSVAIGVGFAKNISIEHNEIVDVPYTGISLGWGWTYDDNILDGNLVKANKIHYFGMKNYDCAGVYTQSNQSNTEVTENYIDSACKASYAHLPSHWFYLYADEGSTGIKFTKNWTPSAKYLQNTKEKSTWWYNNGPQVHDSIKQNAGLEKAFQYLTINKTGKGNQPINEEHSEVIELVMKDGRQLDLHKLKLLLVQNNMDSTAIYHWKNHYVIFSTVPDLSVMEGRLKSNFPEADVKAYHNLFYEYSKKKHCADKTVAKEWTHILLTANLVADKRGQQEYLDYHATQFEKWPDIAKGFCNADFQQLLIFKNGRQLVLVISIPKGKTLDELNPKTTANNPKMIEWNKIMSKYQEGIMGTKPNETWVFLNQL